MRSLALLQLQKDPCSRSFWKSFFWRILGVVILALVTFAYTGCFITTTWVTFLHHATFLFVFYLHERFYQHVDITGLKRAIIKCITYETILGNFILGIITLLITGDIHTMTVITLTYIGIKHFIFVAHDIVWDHFMWRR